MVQVERPNTNEKFALRQKIRKWKKDLLRDGGRGRGGSRYGLMFPPTGQVGGVTRHHASH
jgi:hypothetical protein